MGHALMDKVVTHWGWLPGNAFKALMVLASTAHDDDAKPVYYGGWERVAIVGLGRHDWPTDEDGSVDAERVRKSHWEAARLALGKVREAGAISVKVSGKPGSRAEYWLHLDPLNTGKACTPTQGKPAVGQGKPAPKYPQSPQSPGEITTSSKSVTHQSAQRVADTAKLHRLQLVRDRADAALEASTA